MPTIAAKQKITPMPDKKKLSRRVLLLSALLVFGAITPFSAWAETNPSYDAKKVEDRYASITWSDVIKSGPNYAGYHAYTYYDPFGYGRGGHGFFGRRGGHGFFGRRGGHGFFGRRSDRDFSVSVFGEIEG